MSEGDADRLVVRHATRADSEALARTIAAAFEEYRGKLTPDSAALNETSESIAAELTKDAGAIVALRRERIIGCVMTKPTGDDLYFGRLSVLPHARGHGAARLLVEAVEADARRRDLAGVRLSVRIALPENQRVFAALGYREIGREAHPGFDEPTFINMRKALS